VEKCKHAAVSRLHLVVDQVATKGNQRQSLDAQEPANEAKELAWKLLQLDEGTLSERVREQVRKDATLAHTVYDK